MTHRCKTSRRFISRVRRRRILGLLVVRLSLVLRRRLPLVVAWRTTVLRALHARIAVRVCEIVPGNSPSPPYGEG